MPVPSLGKDFYMFSKPGFQIVFIEILSREGRLKGSERLRN